MPMCKTVDHCYEGGSKTVVDRYHSGNNLGTGPVLFQYYNVYWEAMDDKKDPYLAVLDHRNTPTQGFTTSPAQRMFSRRTKNLLPRTTQLLNPEIIPREVHRSQRIQSQKRQENPVGKKPPDDICGRFIIDVVWPTENGLKVKVFVTSIQVI